MSFIGPRRTLLSGSPDRDVQNWRGAVIANGGTVTAARLASVSTLIWSLKASGAWANADDYWLLVADSATAALTSLKQRRLATAVNSPAFMANAGYTFDGATNYIDTGFIPSAHSTILSPSNSRIAAYERANVAVNAYAAGSINNSTSSLRIRPKVGTSIFAADTISASASYTLSINDSRGLSAASRTGPAASFCRGYRNGLPLTRSADPTGFGVALPASSLLIGAFSNSGTPAGFRATSLGWISVGGALSDAQELAEYNAIQAYMTAWGASV